MADLASTTTPGVIIPPDTTGTDALRALERQYGAAGLEQAITAWQADKDVRARLRFLHQDEDDQATIAALNRMRWLGGTELADELEANWKADVRLVLGKDSCHRILSPALYADLFPEDTDQPERLAQVIPFPVRAAGGAA